MVDISSAAFVNTQIHDTRLRHDKIFDQIIQNALDNFGYDIEIGGQPFIAEVLEVLSGPNVPSQLKTKANLSTLINTDTTPNPEMAENDKSKARVRVIARIPHLMDIGKPKKGKDGSYWSTQIDSIKLTSHPEFIAASRDAQFDEISRDSLILVQMRTDSMSPADGHAAGKIMSHISPPDLLKFREEVLSPKDLFKPDCKSQLNLPTSPKLLVFSTNPRPNLQTPVIRKYKTTIKTGIYGNGTPQTKFHFDAAMKASAASMKEPPIPGSAPGKNNAFIWVGHLRNNGYLDILDRPLGLGRETIIYAPMTLNVEAPIELKYYFHDRGGFGAAWISGPTTSVEQSTTIGLEKNDFKEKIAPAIKDMIRDKRNFILVIPEMAFSRGFGTTSANYTRVDSMARGRGVSPGTLPSTVERTMRTVIDPTARHSVKNYLTHLPASQFTTYGGFLGLFKSAAPIENILQKTHLKERETVTFDGSYTGGKFGDFDQEVRKVISEHLGQAVPNNIKHTSIVADGLGAINLASIVKKTPLSSVHSLAEASFKSVTIDRIDYVESGIDKKTIYNFSQTPSYTIYEDYLLAKAEFLQPFEFNYITEANTPAGSEFFIKIGKKSDFDNVANSAGPSAASRRFTFKVLEGAPAVISMHTVPYSSDGNTKMKVGYAFYAKNDSAPGSLSVPDNNLFLTPSIDSVPDHAETIARSPAAGKIPEYVHEQDQLAPKITSFTEILNKLMGSSKDFCNEHPQYCDHPTGVEIWMTEGGVINNEKLKPQFLKYLTNKERWNELNYLIQEETKLIPHLNNKKKLQEKLTKKDTGIIDRLKKTKKENKDKKYFENIFAGTGFTNAELGESVDVVTGVGFQYNILTAGMQLRTVNPTVFSLAAIHAGEAGPEAETGLHNKVLSRLALQTALGKIQEQLKKQIDSLAPSEPNPIQDPPCPPPLSLRSHQTGMSKPTPKVWNPNSMRIDELCCTGKNIRVVSNYSELKSMINWDVPKPFVPGPFSVLSTKRFSTAKTGLVEAAFNVFYAKEFEYKARGAKNTTRKRWSPQIWSCISDKIAKAWEAACNISGYIPFRITSGIKGYDEGKSDAPVAYQTGISVDAFGLSINVDPPITGYSADGNPIYSVFTGMWTPRFVETHTDELYNLGVLYHNPRGPLGAIGLGALADSGSRYKDNAYQGWSERELREAQNWYWAEDSYNGANLERTAGAAKPDYDKIMDPAKNSPIVPYGADPVLWLLTFCEKSGMKWGNSFFLRKRFRGRKTGTTILGFDFRSDTPPAWTIDEQNRIASMYGITDIVARINAISWPVTSFDKHMHFQYYSGSPIIKWEEIQGN